MCQQYHAIAVQATIAGEELNEDERHELAVDISDAITVFLRYRSHESEFVSLGLAQKVNIQPGE